MSYYIKPKKDFQNLTDQSMLIVKIPESFITNISHQLFDHTITFVNQSTRAQNKFETFVLNIYCILRFGMTNSINKH